MSLTDDERAILDGFFLLTAKPVIYCANIDEKSIGAGNGDVKQLEAIAAVLPYALRWRKKFGS